MPASVGVTDEVEEVEDLVLEEPASRDLVYIVLDMFNVRIPAGWNGDASIHESLRCML